MPLDETLRRLNSLAEAIESDTISCLWNQLKQEFFDSRDSRDEVDRDFPLWALTNVNRKVLIFAIDASPPESLASVRGDIKRRWKPVLASLDASLNVFVLLFGSGIAHSRPAVDAVFALHNQCPDVTLVDLYTAYRSQPLVVKGRVPGSLYRFRRVISSFSPNGTNLWKKRTATIKPALRSLEDAASPDSRRSNSDASDPEQDGGDEDSPPQTPEQPRRLDESQQNIHQSFFPSPKGVAIPLEQPNAAKQPTILPQPPSSPSLFAEEAEVSDLFDGTFDSDSDNEAFVDASGLEHAVIEDKVTDELPPRGRLHDGDALAISQAEPTSPLFSNLIEPATTLLSHRRPKFNTADLTVIEEEEETLWGLDSNVTVRPGRKRSHSTSVIEEPLSLTLKPAPDVKRARNNMMHDEGQPRTLYPSFSPNTPALQPKPRKAIADLALAVDSLSTLRPRTWLNDVIIATISRRLASPDIGIVDSLMLASKHKTPRTRLLLSSVMSKKRTLIFMNSCQHWVVFLWMHDTKTLKEYNSLPSLDEACTGGDLVPSFLKWAYNMPNMYIKVSKEKCPKQTNSFDCGMYALRAAEAIAEGKEMTEIVDSKLERKCLGQALLTSWDATLTPAEIGRVSPTIPKDMSSRVVQLREAFVRTKHLRGLFISVANDATVSSLHAPLQTVVQREAFVIQQSALAGFIAKLQESHSLSLAASLAAQREFEETAERSQNWDSLRTKMKEFLDAYANVTSASDTASIPLYERIRHRNLEAMVSSAQSAEDVWDACQEGSSRQAEDIAGLRKLVHANYLETCTHIVILKCIVWKFRENEARWKRE
ncbi:hypothetical protein ColLi_13122 [Colletotrichum liriopes]|uniref:Ubiquitin-like protease family profile domain-containing protein n=1 Tax=Colletotrichum liriopes TaxID=708192 RepID=A0AA37GZM0_9PEZI|nr:hypothetical protein ColLi_13122 [Colletotrichum liriopes]